MSRLRDDNGEPVVLYHGTRAEFGTLDPAATVDGGLHFGSLAQAQMRCGKRGRLIQAHLYVGKPRRCRDLGGQWKAKIAQAKSAGHQAIIYLNRYEGIPFERVQEASEQGIDLDKLTDAQFRKRVPEAQDSWIVFSMDHVRVLQTDVLPHEGTIASSGRKPSP